MRRGKGKIIELAISGGIVTLTLRVHGGQLVVHGETRMTLDALTAIFAIAPRPAPPTDLRGKRIAYQRDGQMLMAIGPVE